MQTTDSPDFVNGCCRLSLRCDLGIEWCCLPPLFFCFELLNFSMSSTSICFWTLFSFTKTNQIMCYDKAGNEGGLIITAKWISSTCSLFFNFKSPSTDISSNLTNSVINFPIKLSKSVSITFLPLEATDCKCVTFKFWVNENKVKFVFWFLTQIYMITETKKDYLFSKFVNSGTNFCQGFWCLFDATGF